MVHTVKLDSELPAPLEACVEVDVPFQDADPMGVTWHGNYFRYLEAARAMLLARIGYGYRDMVASGYLWPIVEAEIKYVKPTVFGQPLAVTASLVEYETRLRIVYTIVDRASGECVTKAQTTQAAVRKDSGEMCFCSPRALLDKVRACVGSG